MRFLTRLGEKRMIQFKTQANCDSFGCAKFAKFMKKRPANWKPRTPKNAVIVHYETPHIPGVDDYELPAELDIDYSKAKPNRFAARFKYTHGGARKGAGRK